MTGTIHGPDSRVLDDPWGARARDWAEIEDENSRSLFEAVFDATAVGRGTKLLDVGCGSGLAGAIAAARGATVSGLDASRALLQIARERVPDGDFRHGDMKAIPFADDAFDVVTFINTFFFASDPETTLREAARVARRGGTLGVVAWPAPDKVELTAYLLAVARLLPPSPVEVDPFIAQDEFAERAARAGFALEEARELDWSWQYRDLETALRGLLSPGLSTLAIESAGEPTVRDALTSALAPYRLASGAYRIENRVNLFLAKAL